MQDLDKLKLPPPTPEECPTCKAPLRYDGSTDAWICTRPTAFCSKTYTGVQRLQEAGK
jgi:hypothetical protein